MEKYFFIIFIILCFSCKSKSQNKNIEGNWYTYDSLKTDQLDQPFINYSEVHINKNEIFTYNELTGLSSVKNYIISNDSLSIKFKNEKTFKYIGTVDFISEEVFTVKNQFKTTKYYQLVDVNTLNKYIINENIELNTYSKAFFKRLNKQIDLLEK